MKKNFFLGFLIAFFLLGIIGIANAVIVNINSRTNHEGNPVTVFFTAGTYNVIPVGTSNGGVYNAWNAWDYGRVTGCDSNGENCSAGWLNRYNIYSSEFGEMELTDHIRYANQYLALSNAIFTSFTLTTDASVAFFMRDGTNGSLSWDNVGGMSLNITESCPFFVKHLETSNNYVSLQSAYDDSTVYSSDTLLLSSDLNENVFLDRDIEIRLIGGYDCDFNEPPVSMSTIGSMTISNGTIIVENIILKELPFYIVVSAGQVWMDRNLGATRVATSPTDSLAYGDLYQWGRGADGHQLRNSGTTSTLSPTDEPGHGNFIIAPNDPWDWRFPQNDNLWQGVSGTNNPCPVGFRLPTDTEWSTEIASWGTQQNSTGAFASPLKLPVAGYRNNSNGIVTTAGSEGFYWSSTVPSLNAKPGSLEFDGSTAAVNVSRRAYGMSVRCIKD